MRFTRLLGASIACSCLLAAAPATSSAVLTSPETLLLDTHNPDKTLTVTAAVKTAEPLAPGGFYVARATGTYSRYKPGLMKGGTPLGTLCGTTEDAPLIPSPLPPDSRVGIDPEWAFGYYMKPPTAPCPSPALRPIGAFQISNGGAFKHIVATNRGTAPRADHSYTYLIEGTGVPASFRYTDDRLSDNNGVISIVIEPVTKPAEQCAGSAACEEASASGQTPAITTAAATTSPIAAAPPGARSCASRRRFRIRLVDSRTDPIRAAAVRVNGKTVKVRSAKLGGRTRRIAYIDLRGLPSNRFTISITAKTKSGKVLRGSRRYFTCKPKLKGGKPKL